MGQGTAADSFELEEDICPRNTRKNAKKEKRRKNLNRNRKIRKRKKRDIIYKEESYKIIGACFEVYKNKGCGFTESVYQECLAIELGMQNIPFFEQPKIQLEYKGKTLEQYFEPDFICYDKIILEIKALPNLLEISKAQVINYLNATKFELALLANFGHYPQLEYKRLANNKIKNSNNGNIRTELNSWIRSKE